MEMTQRTKDLNGGRERDSCRAQQPAESEADEEDVGRRMGLGRAGGVLCRKLNFPGYFYFWEKTDHVM